MMSLAMLSALTFRPVLPTGRGKGVSLINMDNWRNPRYVVWVLSIFFGLFGYVSHIKMLKNAIVPTYVWTLELHQK